MTLDVVEHNDTQTTNVGSQQMQHTVSKPVTITGRGLLTGCEVDIVVEPAATNAGIVFERVDLDAPVRIEATVDHAIDDRPRRTALGIGDVTIETVEHLMSALSGLGVDNALIRVDGPEIPGGDGSALLFAEKLARAGFTVQDEPRRILNINEPIYFQEGDAMIAAFPSDQRGLQVVYDLDYGEFSDRISRQTQSWNSSNGSFLDEIAPARTFSLQEEATALQAKGMCTHLSPSEVLVIGDDGPIDNAYRFENEPVRHKILDIIGDLYLAGGHIQARIVASRSGHSLNRRLCQAIIEQNKLHERSSVMQDGCTMDVREIQRIMPHRYPMLLVDRVVEMDGDQRALGIKNVTINEPFFEGHYPGTPIMPGVLIVEAMAQLGGLLMSRKLEHTGKIAILLSLDHVKLRHPVTPGDQLLLEAVAVRAGTRTASLKCKAYVGSKIAAEASVKFMMVDAEQE
ncbi:MAG: UDP-3-O-acyl-N-acetylglucosamine deacetylase [Phycisphaerales bacterium]|jgi:UDP-3-O-[3-hydroxymyristoyl] N-acetylglucosamine deacetylase/3-hydroxyacyl-[acyl-carrier-protein] dehydratase|nr:UDP-3-O-acyl-N-acetylglucosamine deacetylase [Phycisphaerales bacterium]